ncbi:MAG: ribonuclease HII [Proteobacteria bacterium]|nr:ribonuclease HII [Pseudomonadota bacterium]MBU1687276.1 ribonuclease HII [Pseudomonadota bacterium]
MIPQRLFPEHGFVETDPFSFERHLKQQGFGLVAGTDEAGRGPLAGPVVAACVILPDGCDHPGYKDSKQLSAVARAGLRRQLVEIGAKIGVGIVSPEEIDRVNILQASLLAMKKSLEDLKVIPDFLLVDGKFPVPICVAQKALIKGESRSRSIAAASIIAKEVRDEIMLGYDQQYPQFDFAVHKGYPTRIHRQRLQEFGPCPIHRRSFKGVREHFENHDG